MGLAGIASNTTDVTVNFGQYRTQTNTTYGSTTSITDWSAIDNDPQYKWRVVKHSAGVPVGYGEATDTLLGLVKKPSTFSAALNGELTGTVYGTKTPEGWVTLHVSATTFSSNSSPESSAGLIPSAFRPSETLTSVIQISSLDIQKIIVESDGTIGYEFRDYAASLSARVNTGSCSVTYYVGS
jgi:hypothetical protein